MTTNQTGNTSKTVDTGHVTAPVAQAMGKTSPWNGDMDTRMQAVPEKTGARRDLPDASKAGTPAMHKEAGVKTQDAAVHEKPLPHKGVSADPKYKDHNMHKDADLEAVPEKTSTHKDMPEAAKAGTPAMHKDAGVKTQDAAVHEKPLPHKGVSADPKYKDHNMHKDADLEAVPEKTGTHKDMPEAAKAGTPAGQKDAGVKSPGDRGYVKNGSHNDMSSSKNKSREHALQKDADMKAQDAAVHEKTGSHDDGSGGAKGIAFIRREIYTQIAAALSGARWPVKNQADLLSALPDGAATTYQAGTTSMTAGEAGKLLKDTDFPFHNAKAVADVIVQRASL
jgi:hypothetical protein